NATKGCKLYDNNFEFLKRVLDVVSIPAIAEGNIFTPEMARKVLEMGAHSVIVGGAITRPQQITARFINALHS
ncbi:tRNA-dihydrouridine synthase, partial [Paenibacillus larvae]